MHVIRALKRALREVGAVLRGTTATHDHLRMRLAAITAASLVVDVIATVIVYFVERHTDNTDIHTIGDALFWTTAQMLTVSSQFSNPHSTVGRVVDIGVEFWSISAVTTLAGSFGAFFHRRGHERDAALDAAGGRAPVG